MECLCSFVILIFLAFLYLASIELSAGSAKAGFLISLLGKYSAFALLDIFLNI